MTGDLILVPKKNWEYACQCREVVQRLKEQIEEEIKTSHLNPDNHVLNILQKILEGKK